MPPTHHHHGRLRRLLPLTAVLAMLFGILPVITGTVPTASATSIATPPLSTREQFIYAYVDSSLVGGSLEVTGKVRNRSAADGAIGSIRNLYIQVVDPAGVSTITTYTSVNTTIRTIAISRASGTAGVWTIHLWAEEADGSLATAILLQPFAVNSYTDGISMSGRVWSERVKFEQRNSDANTANDDPADFAFYYLSRTGGQYRANYYDYMGYSSDFWADNIGIADANCNPTRRSADWNQVSPDYGAYDESTGTYKLGEYCVDQTRWFTYRVFWEAPDNTMPASAAWAKVTGSGHEATIAVTSTWVMPVYRAATLTANWVQSNPNLATYAGTFNFNTTQPGTIKVEIDTNNNGVYTDTVDRSFGGGVPAGASSSTWDGKNGSGVAVSRLQKVNWRVTLSGMNEIHFVEDDVETQAGGVTITQLKGPSVGLVQANWDDSYMVQTHCWWYDAGYPHTTACDGVKPNPMKGVALSGTQHSWTGGIRSWGDQRYIDNYQFDPTVLAANGSMDESAAVPTLSISKTDGVTTLTPGQTVTYTVTATNNHPWLAESAAVIKDRLPAVGMTMVSASNGGTLSGSTVTWPATTIPANGGSVTRTVTLTVNADVARPFTFVNWATVDGATGPNPPADPTTSCPAPLCASDTDAVPPMSFTVSKSDGASKLRAGENTTYTITAKNTGTATETGVNVVDTLPTESTYVSSSAGGSSASGKVTWSGLSFTAGETKTFTVTVKANATLTGTTFVNSVAVTKGSYTVTASDTDAVAIDGVTVQKEICTTGNACSASAAPGASGWGETVLFPDRSNLLWRVRLRNTGNTDLTNLVVTDPLLPGCASTTASLAAGTDGAWVTCTQSAVRVGFTNTASVNATTDNAKSVTGSDTATVSIIANPVVTIDKTAPAVVGTSVVTGSTVAWNYVVTNTGNVTINGLGVTDDKGVVVTCPKSSLVMGEVMTCTGSGKVS